MSPAEVSSFDVIVAGGGMIGTSLALALVPTGLRVAVVEAVARSDDEQPSFDERSTALSRSTQRMFEAMGLWETVAAAATPIRHIHVSDRGRFGFSHIDAEQQNVEALGYVVINRILGNVLQTALRRAPAVDVLCPARITAVDVDGELAHAVVGYGDGREARLSAPLLVAADGANSTVREMLGIGATQSDYGQHAVIGNLLPEKPMRNVAYERFTSRGPLALLPISGERAAFVWTVGADDAEYVLGLSDGEFLEALQDEFGYRLGEFSKVGKRAGYPLALSKADATTAMRSVLVGNAAHGLHPVAAQGFNLGMRDVAALCDCIVDAVSEDSGAASIGNADVLDRYARWRRDDQRKLLRFTDGLVRLFGSRRMSLKILRSAGMLGFDLIPGVRGEFARHTMGLAGRLPRLSRGVPLT